MSDQATYYSLPDNTEFKFPNGVYTTTTAGSFSFWVAYKTENTIKTPSTITAVNFAIPDRPADPNPSSTSFVRRVLVMQFTGTGCGYCPLIVMSSGGPQARSRDISTVRNIHHCDPYGFTLVQPSRFLDCACGYARNDRNLSP